MLHSFVKLFCCLLSRAAAETQLSLMTCWVVMEATCCHADCRIAHCQTVMQRMKNLNTSYSSSLLALQPVLLSQLTRLLLHQTGTSQMRSMQTQAKSMNQQHAGSSFAVVRRKAPAAASNSSRGRQYHPANTAEGHDGPPNKGVLLRVRQIMLGSLYRCKAGIGHP